MVERFHGKEEVVSSTLTLGSKNYSSIRELVFEYTEWAPRHLSSVATIEPKAKAADMSVASNAEQRF